MWFKVDDHLHSHPKRYQVSLRALGLWTLAGSWCGENGTGGRLPSAVLSSLGGKRADAKELVDARLWEVVPGGWQFHDWDGYQPDVESIKAGREKQSLDGARGNHTKWHVRRNIVVPTCPFCIS